MVKRICPICDQVMKSSHFCWNCRTWIKHPYEREMNFYLNERHPGNESQCEYHGTDQTYSGGTAASGGIYADVDLNRQMNKQTRGNSSQMAGARLGGSGMSGGGTRPGGNGMSGSGTRSGGSGMPGSGMGVGGNGMSGSGTRPGGNGMPGSMPAGSVRPASPNMAGAGQGSSSYGQRSPRQQSSGDGPACQEREGRLRHCRGGGHHSPADRSRYDFYGTSLQRYRTEYVRRYPVR